MKYITRTMRHYNVSAFKVEWAGNEMGKTEVSADTFEPIEDKAAAINLLEEIHGEADYIGIKISSDEQKYRIPFDAFMQYAELVSNKKEDNVNG